MNVSAAIKQHALNHPAAEPQDLLKYCYQAAFGAEHLLSDPAPAERYFKEEWAAVSPDPAAALYEETGENYIRLNLAAWKAEGLRPEWLWALFLMNASEAQGSEKDRLERFNKILNEASAAVRGGCFAFGPDAWQEALRAYPKDAPEPLHHSAAFRRAEKPSYRLLSARSLLLLPILRALSPKLEKQAPGRCLIIALDGRAAAGKSTLAEALSRVLDCGVVHMDDFFLPAELRSPKRLAEAGGNVHYERFLSDVMPFLGKKEAFSYQAFDCETMAYGEIKTVRASDVRIVEGAYSLHPKFGDYAALKVFIDIAPENQYARILSRNGEAMARRFSESWIPMEEKYIRCFRPDARADLRIRTDK